MYIPADLPVCQPTCSFDVYLTTNHEHNLQLTMNTHPCPLLLVYIPDSSSVLRTHKPMLSFQLSKMTYLSTQLLVYIPTQAPVYQPASSFFPFGLTCALTCELICWSMYPKDLPTPKYMYLLILILSFRQTTKTYRSTQPRVHIPIDATVFHPTCSF